MKKQLLFFVSVIIVILTSINTFTLSVNANGNDVYNKGSIFINGKELSSTDTVIISEDEMFIPMRTVLEALGATVEWNQENGDIIFFIENKSYICHCRKDGRGNYMPPLHWILIHDTEKKEPLKSKDCILLSPWGAYGSYEIINDRTYLYGETGRRLIEALDYKVQIDLEQNKLIIYNNDEGT